jgi:hypothetical protein
VYKEYCPIVLTYAGLEVPTMESMLFWVVTPFSSERALCSGRACLDLQIRRVGQERKIRNGRQIIFPLVCVVVAVLIYCHVTFDGVLDWILVLLTTFTHYSVITLNYTGIGDFHTSPNHAKSITACSAFTRRFQVTVSNNGYSSASILPKWRLPSNWTILTSIVLITPLHGPRRKHRFQQYLYCYIRFPCRVYVFTEPMPRNGSTGYDIYIYIYI